MTTTEHAELIERLKLARTNITGTCSMNVEAGLKCLFDDAIAALRTSYRDGWLGAAGQVAAIGDACLVDDVTKRTLCRAAETLRRNAPQESD